MIDAPKAGLRRALRQRRAAIAIAQRRRADREALRHMLRSTYFRDARHVAIYLSVGSELATRTLVKAMLRRGRHVYVPKAEANGTMRFIRLGPHTPLRRGAFGIPEPAPNAPMRAARHMDLVVVPVVGFDAQGWRLGMGGGYYDRALRFARAFRRPALVGYAHAAQEVDALPRETHDVRLDAVVTERGVRRARLA